MSRYRDNPMLQAYNVETLTTLCPKNVTTLYRYNSDTYESILIIFGINVTEKVGNQEIL